MDTTKETDPEFDRTDLDFLDELTAYGTLLELMDESRHDVNIPKDRFPAILSAAGKKIGEAYPRFREKICNAVRG
jgi:hypothetical protein